MSEWKKMEQPPEPLSSDETASMSAPSAFPSPHNSSPAPTDIPAAETTEPKTDVPAPPSQQVDSSRPIHRKRQHRLAAPLGCLVLLLALVGGISLLISGWGALKKAVDDTPLKQEISDFLNPVMLQNPSAVSSPKEAASNASCIKAALWQITETERIRMRQEKADCRFSSDDSDRLLIPEKEVTAAFQHLFGKAVSPDTRVFAEKTDGFAIWYDKQSGQYHVPAFTASLYQPVVDTIKKKDGAYLVRIGYVAAADIAVDDKGNDVPPTPADASIFQQYTVRKTDGGYQLTAITDIP